MGAKGKEVQRDITKGERRRPRDGRRGGDGDIAAVDEVDKLTQQRLDKTIQFYVDEDFEAADKMLDRLRVRSLNSEERKRYYAWRGYIASALGDLNGARKNLVLATELTAASHSDLEVYLFQLA